MYWFERTHRWKFVFVALTIVSVILFFLGYGGGGRDMILYGFVNNPLYCIAMVVSLFSAIFCLIASLTLNALEKDITEWIRSLEANGQR